MGSPLLGSLARESAAKPWRQEKIVLKIRGAGPIYKGEVHGVSGSSAESALSSLPALSKIPPFPPIVLRVFDLLASEDVEIRRLVELVTADPAFSAQILRLANSPLFGFHSRIDSLQHALVILGLRRVRSLAMTVATANYMHAALKVRELERCWRHTLACAILTEELARVCSFPDDVAYTAGLLHDIGRLGLLVAHPAPYAQLMQDATRNSVEILDLERKLFGVDHCEAGRLLAQQWNLPEDILIVAGRHHDPPDGPVQDLSALTYLGCQLADSLGFWVVPPLRPLELEQIRAWLPESARNRFVPSFDQLSQAVERRIRSHAVLLGAAPEPAASTPTVAEALPEEQADDEARPAATAAARARSPLQDLGLVVVLGSLFAAVFLGVVYLLSR